MICMMTMQQSKSFVVFSEFKNRPFLRNRPFRPFLTVTRKRKRVPESCFGCHKERQPTKNEKRNWRSFSGHTKTSVVFVCPENKFGREMAGFAFRFRFSVAVRATHGPKANLSELFSFSCRAHRKEWPYRRMRFGATDMHTIPK